VNYLILKGVEVNKSNVDADTPLCFAYQASHIEVVVKILLYYGVDVNKANINEHTPLYIACSEGLYDIVRYQYVKILILLFH
jgi:ankyrin repeat protein